MSKSVIRRLNCQIPLKPCPFCGSKAEFEEYPQSGKGNYLHIYCIKGCALFELSGTITEKVCVKLAKKWNTRHE